MNIIGRYEKVVLAGAHGIGPPMILDRGRAQEAARLRPYRVGEWVSDGRLWAPALRGGSGSWYGTFPTVRLGRSGSVSIQTLALDSAYTFGAAGDAYAARVRMLNTARQLIAANMFVSSFTGTAANVNDILIELRNDTSNFPGSTIHDSQVHDPTSTVGWRRQTGFTFSLLENIRYWLSISDPDGNGTDFAVMNVRDANVDGEEFDTCSFTTTDGWQTKATNADVAYLVLEFADGSVLGNPITAIADTASGTFERGWLLNGGFAGGVLIVGMASDTNAGTTIKLYAEGVAPGGATLESGTRDILDRSTIRVGVLFDNPAYLAPFTTYRSVFDYSASLARPQKASIGAGSHGGLRKALWGHGNYVWTEESGGNWVEDLNGQPALSLILSGLAAVEAPPPGTNVYPLRRMMS